MKVSYDPVGSGTGREQFLNGSVLFAGSDKAMSADEVAKAKERCSGSEALELPVYISPIAVAYNLPGSPAHLNLTPETLAKVFNGDIKTWNDPAIAADNPGVPLPSTAIVPVNRSDNSGTNGELHRVPRQGGRRRLAARTEREVAPPGHPVRRADVRRRPDAPGLAGHHRLPRRLPGAKGHGDRGRPRGQRVRALLAQAAAAVVDASPAAPDATDLRLTIDIARDTTQAGAYPVVLVSYEIACSLYDKKQDADNVKALLTYIASPEGQDRAADPSVAGSAPITDATAPEGRRRHQPDQREGLTQAHRERRFLAS